jgi:hypothetical protein
MSSTTETPVIQRANPVRPDLGQTLAAIAGSWRTGLAMLLLIILQQSLGHHNADNSWLMTVAERLLAGERIYADIIETNPPASFLIYVPAAAAARLLHLPVEFVTSAMTFMAAIGALYLGIKSMQQAGLLDKAARAVVANAGIFALLAVPGICFAQREHIALILLTPVLFIFAIRAQNIQVSFVHAAIAGMMAGAGVCIKPYFLLVMALPFAAVLWRRRTITAFWNVENILAAAICITYLGSVWLYFAEFLAILPGLLDTYIKVTNPVHWLVTNIYFLLSLIMILTLAFLVVCKRLDSLSLMLASGGAGFTIAALVQGKGWLNHYQPGLSLLLFALAAAAAPALVTIASGRTAELKSTGWNILRFPTMFVLAPALLVLPLLYGAPNQFAMQQEYPGLKQAVERHAPAQPSIMAISVSLDVAFPLVRQLRGRWVGQANILWLMGYACVLLDNGRGDAAKMQAYIDADAKMFAANVRDRRPDIILVASGSHIDKIKQHPAIAAALAGYRQAETASNIAILVPRKQ